MYSTTFGPARSFQSHNLLASYSELAVLFVAERPCDADDACVPYVRGGSRKNEKPSSSYRCPTFAQPAFQQAKTIKEKRQWITIARSPDFAATLVCARIVGARRLPLKIVKAPCTDKRPGAFV
jgi:hypothetical protein